MTNVLSYVVHIGSGSRFCLIFVYFLLYILDYSLKVKSNLNKIIIDYCPAFKVANTFDTLRFRLTLLIEDFS